MCQTICKQVSERLFRINPKSDNITFFDFYTQNIWKGLDQEIFWVRKDEDLIRIMIDHLINVFSK